MYNAQRIMFAAVLLLAAQPIAADSVISYRKTGATADNTFLLMPQGKVRGEADADGVTFRISGAYTGYCAVESGRTAHTIYIEDGARLAVVCRAATQQPAFVGACAEENRFFAAAQRRLIKPADITPAADALRALLSATRDSVGSRAGLSPAFRELETQRQQYAVLNACYRKAGWHAAQLPPAETWMKELPALWMTKAYRAFFLDALYAMARPDDTVDIHGYTKAELTYAAEKMTDATMRNAVTQHVISTYMQQRGADQTDDLMPLVMKTMTDTAMLNGIVREHALWSKVKRGSRIPDFSFADTTGKRHTLSQWRGKYILIDCWATWCGPCKNQLPHLERLISRYKNRGIVFVSLSSDKNRAAWQKMVTEKKMQGVQLNEPDADAEFFRLFRVAAIPRFILLAPDGTVYDANLPRPSDPALAALLDTLL